MEKQKIIEQIEGIEEIDRKLIIDHVSGEVRQFTGLEVSRAQFTLQKIKVDRKTKCVRVDFILQYLSNSANISIPGYLYPNEQASEPLLDDLAKLKDYLCDVKKIQKAAHERGNVIVTALELSGFEDSACYKIKGSQKSDGDQYSDLNTHKINYSENEFPFNAKVTEIAEDLETEAFE